MLTRAGGSLARLHFDVKQLEGRALRGQGVHGACASHVVVFTLWYSL